MPSSSDGGVKDENDEREAAFIKAIMESPNDEAARLVYADWLEEQGDERAEYLRLENMMWKLPPRIAELQRTLDQKWLHAVSRNVDFVLLDTHQKINAIRLVRELIGLGLKEAKDLVESCPVVIQGDIPYDEAMALQKRFRDECAAITELRSASWRGVPAGPEPLLRVVLVDCRDDQRSLVIAAIRELFGHSEDEARKMVAESPTTLREGVSSYTAKWIRDRFGGLCQLRVELMR